MPDVSQGIGENIFWAVFLGNELKPLQKHLQPINFLLPEDTNGI